MSFIETNIYVKRRNSDISNDWTVKKSSIIGTSISDEDEMTSFLTPDYARFGLHTIGRNEWAHLITEGKFTNYQIATILDDLKISEIDVATNWEGKPLVDLKPILEKMHYLKLHRLAKKLVTVISILGMFYFIYLSITHIIFVIPAIILAMLLTSFYLVKK